MQQRSLNLYRGCKAVVDTEYRSGSDRSPVIVIVEALAEAAGVDPSVFPPLYEFVDPDAINHLLADRSGASRADAMLSFQVNTWNVFVRSDGRIRVCDGTRPTDPQPVFESTIG